MTLEVDCAPNQPPRRWRMPRDRQSTTHKFKVGEVEGYLIVGFYEDGSVGEFFIRLDKMGSTASGFADQWAICMSMLLQVGYPLVELCQKFVATRFEPAGMTGNPEIAIATSVCDYVGRYLIHRFGPEETP